MLVYVNISMLSPRLRKVKSNMKQTVRVLRKKKKDRRDRIKYINSEENVYQQWLSISFHNLRLHLTGV